MINTSSTTADFVDGSNPMVPSLDYYYGYVKDIVAVENMTLITIPLKRVIFGVEVIVKNKPTSTGWVEMEFTNSNQRPEKITGDSFSNYYVLQAIQHAYDDNQGFGTTEKYVDIKTVIFSWVEPTGEKFNLAMKDLHFRRLVNTKITLDVSSNMPSTGTITADFEKDTMVDNDVLI